MTIIYQKASELPDAPVLTLPPEEAELVLNSYASAKVILEYGSGGSTVVAGAMPGKLIFSVENDLDWARKMKAWFKANPPAGTVIVHAVDIGPTREWGIPADHSAWRNYYHYPSSVWDRPDFEHPNLILIDGRFRTACFVTAALRITKPVTVLWDDYLRRRAYHEVEQHIPLRGIHGRMGRFELTPGELPMHKLGWMLKQFTRHM